MTGTTSGALLSDCGRFRWRLWRTWRSGVRLVFVMLNPSIADADIDDPTIRRCIGFARDLGYAGIEVVNVYPFRATDPAELARAHAREGVELVAQRQERNRHVADVVEGAEVVVAAWGAHRLADPEWRSLGLPLERLQALATTAAGAPRHPLYLPRSARPSAWPAAVG